MMLSWREKQSFTFEHPARLIKRSWSMRDAGQFSGSIPYLILIAYVSRAFTLLEETTYVKCSAVMTFYWIFR